VTPLEAALGVAVGFAAGILAGLFGVGGGIVTTPAINTILGGTAIQAIATPFMRKVSRAKSIGLI